MIILPLLRGGAGGQRRPARSLAGPPRRPGECVAPAPPATMQHETAGKEWASSRGRLALTCPGGVLWLAGVPGPPGRACPRRAGGLDRLQPRPDEDLDGALVLPTMIAEGRGVPQFQPCGLTRLVVPEEYLPRDSGELCPRQLLAVDRWHGVAPLLR